MPKRKSMTRSQYKAATDECLKEMKRLQEQMDADQAEIDRLREGTRLLLAQMREKPPPREEPFVGMWKDRDGMQDSTAWVRKLRGDE
jgi:hypothetical protein